jgi:hypothetical protein
MAAGLYASSALQTWTRQLTGRRRLHVFHSEAPSDPVQQVACVFVCENACASSLANTLDVFPLVAFVPFFLENPFAPQSATS